MQRARAGNHTALPIADRDKVCLLELTLLAISVLQSPWSTVTSADAAQACVYTLSYTLRLIMYLRSILFLSIVDVYAVSCCSHHCV